MGLAGGIVRKVFSKSPCLTAGTRSHSERSSVDHKSRWSSLRMYLCGDELNASPEEDEVASVKSFGTTVVQVSGDEQSNNSSNSGKPEDQGAAGENSAPAKSLSEEDAAILIQAAFKGLKARRQFKEMKTSAERDCSEEPKSPTSPSIAASVEVQVGESFSALRLSQERFAMQQHQANQKARPSVFRVKDEWDDSTVSSNTSRMRIQNKIEAMTRRERAMAYAFSQQLRSCSGTKKRSARSDQTEFNVGWSWLERWMATRQTEASAEDCLSKNADSCSAGRRVIVIKKRYDLAIVEKESCGSNDVSVSFEASNNTQTGTSCRKPAKNRLKGGRSVPRHKVASDHRFQARSNKVSKKGHQREEQEQPKYQSEAKYADASQPPTDY